MIPANVDHFEQFRRIHRDSKIIQAKNQETVSLLLSNFGNDIYNCSEKFFEQGIEFKDLASLSREDLKLFGIEDYEMQTEMLDTFSQLTKQDYNLNEIKHSEQGQKYNGQIIESALSYLDTMRLSLTAANIKLKLKPSSDVVVDEKNFASKFVLDALNELQNVTSDVAKQLEILEQICGGENIKIKPKESKNHVITYATLGTITLLCISFVIWKLR